MPRKTDSIPINNELLDRRVKLTKAQKAEIFMNRDGLSQRGLARLYGVSRRTIQFILDPEKKVRDLANRKARGGSKIYYDREKHTKAIREHRDYKKSLNEKGLLITKKESH
jgi:transposase InsO family protein